MLVPPLGPTGLPTCALALSLTLNVNDPSDENNWTACYWEWSSASCGPRLCKAFQGGLQLNCHLPFFSGPCWHLGAYVPARDEGGMLSHIWDD